ncbi:hypothetical protein [Acidovorax sp. KKS102]|uniref:hypothetical protein n=1 Tax=Acidovorax sp. KKS102 TaxID=358220 RepID=UPI00143C2537|nr:hypothetical protein [Acidovorax sp. KKS102]
MSKIRTLRIRLSGAFQRATAVLAFHRLFANGFCAERALLEIAMLSRSDSQLLTALGGRGPDQCSDGSDECSKSSSDGASARIVCDDYQDEASDYTEHENKNAGTASLTRNN